MSADFRMNVQEVINFRNSATAHLNQIAIIVYISLQWSGEI